jgi:signal transduction histidine kinase
MTSCASSGTRGGAVKKMAAMSIRLKLILAFNLVLVALGILGLSTVPEVSSDRVRVLLIGGLAAVALLIFVVGHPLVTYIDRRLRALAEATERITRGDLSQRIAIGGRDEFGALARAFNAMVDSLEVARDEVVRLHDQALQMREERIALLREGLTRVVQAQEGERKRVARELHDQAGQGLAALQVGLSGMEKAAPSDEVAQAAASLRSLAIETMHIIRNLGFDLRPSALDELGLVPALRDYIRIFSSRVDIPIHFEFEAFQFDEALSEEAKVTLFRIVQEGLANIAKHARATHAGVSLCSEDHIIRLVIEDDGVGFDVQRALGQQGKASLGLFGMQERCNLLAGDLQIFSEPTKGTKLTITVPHSTHKRQVKESGVLEAL